MVMSGPIVVFACGDELRGDDGVAPFAVRALPSAVAAGVEVRVLGAVAVEDLVALSPGTRVVIVDAVVGPAPGQLVELDLAALPAGVTDRAALALITTSSHQLPLGDMLALAALLRDAPIDGRFVGIGIRSVAFGSELSGPVADALPALTDAVSRAILAIGGPETLAP
jgi:hydrogenase maturation protease